MGDLRRGTRFLKEYIFQNEGEAVTVVQGENSYDLTAVPGYEESASDDAPGLFINSRQQDFIFDPDEMLDKGVREFARGDKIVWKREHKSTDEDGNEVIVREETDTHEVMSDGNEPSWRPDSRYHNWIRVHTKRLLKPEYIKPPATP